MNGTLLFTPGVLLCPHSPDYTEVVRVDGKLNTEAYNALVERRLLPLLLHADDEAQKAGNKAIIALPGVGCGYFAGKFKHSIDQAFQTAVQTMLEKHKNSFSQIALVQMEGEQKFSGTDVGNIKFKMSKNRRGLLSKPEVWGKEYKDCKLYKVVAWDHLSWPGNDFYDRNTRRTDDGVSAAATNICEVMTGVQGSYHPEAKKFLYENGQDDWRKVIKMRDIKFTKYQILVAIEGKLVPLKELKSAPSTEKKDKLEENLLQFTGSNIQFTGCPIPVVAPSTEKKDKLEENLLQFTDSNIKAYVTYVACALSKNTTRRRFVEISKNGLITLITTKQIFSVDQISKIQNIMENNVQTLEQIFDDYQNSKKNFDKESFFSNLFTRIINWIKELFGGGLAAEVAEKQTQLFTEFCTQVQKIGQETIIE